MHRKMLWLAPLLLALTLACQLPGTVTPSTSGGDAIATRVAAIFTQTALATTPLPTTSPLPIPTLPPTPTARPVTPPYEGACTPALTGTVPVPSPNPDDAATFVGYRYYAGRLDEIFPAFRQGPRFGTLLNAASLGPGTWGDGFALDGFRRDDLGVWQLFFQRMVCRRADGKVYWEITDALALPLLTSPHEVLLVSPDFTFVSPDAFAGSTSTLGLGWYATLECTPALSTRPVARVRFDAATLPPTIGRGTRLPVDVLALWRLDPVLQRFQPLDPAAYTCELLFH